MSEPADELGKAPPLLRRMLCMVYEGILLFGVLMLAGLLYAGLTNQRHALHGQWGLRIFLFIVLGGYFVWFWTHGGQTLAMKTWHIRLVAADGSTLGAGRAAARYLLAWVWFLPALAGVAFSGLTGSAVTATVVLAGALAYAALSRLHGTRQFWHDLVCRTRLIDTRNTTMAPPKAPQTKGPPSSAPSQTS